MADPVPTPPPPAAAPVTPEPPKDMSQYIRTFAKDVARLTNQPAPVIAPAPTPAPKATPDVSLPEVDESPVNRPDGVAKEFPQESLTLSKDDSSGIFAGSGAAAAPLPSVGAPDPSDSERREEVLARLRAKIAAREEAPPPPVEVFVPPTPIPPPPPAPLPPPAPTPLPPPEPTPGVIPLTKTDSASSPLHTYTSDFADRIDEKQASTFSVLAAQEDAGQGRKQDKKRGSAIPVVLAVVLILLGGGGLYAVYRLTSAPTTQVTLGIPSLIFADEKTELVGPDYRADLASAAAQPLVEGNVLVTYVTSASTTAIGVRKEPQPGGALIRLLNLGAPDILMRNVDLMSTVGVVSAGGETRPFFILRVNSYERTFAGMLGWEPRMHDDLAFIYPEYPSPAPAAPTASASSTATTSVPTLTPSPSPSKATGAFADAVIANHDVRVLKDAGGRTLIIYGYVNNETLIIARDEAAFTTIAARLAAAAGK